MTSVTRELAPDHAAARTTVSRRRLSWPAAVAALAILVLPLLSGSSFHLHLAVLICLNVVIVSGLAILSRTGQLSFCHAAFVGLGAYGSVLAGKYGVPFLLSAALGTALAATVAFLLGAAILRLRGVYFVLITFAFGELFRLALLEGGAVTGGANGISGIPPAQILGLVLDTRRSFYCLAALLAAATVVFLAILFRTPKGHMLDAVGDNAQLAEASGLSVQDNRLFAFTLGSAFAGLGGACLAHYVGFVSPESFSTHVSVAVIIMLVVGGRASVLGPPVGAMIMTPLPELFRGAVQTQNILYGITLILILRFLPQGLAGFRLPGRPGGRP
jgi:branched-chain amino acid transport system permease protein